MSTCDNCIEETDSVVCDDCQEHAWESAERFGREQGAAVAFGLMAMADAIRRTYLCCQCDCYVGLPPEDEGMWSLFCCDCYYNDDHTCSRPSSHVQRDPHE